MRRVLNAVYLARLDASARAARRRLVVAERRWVGRRDAVCQVRSDDQDAAVAARWCLLEETDARIDALRRGG